MKGIFNDVLTIFGVLLFMVGATVSVISLITEMSIVTGSLVKASFEKLGAIDTAYNLKSCMYGKGLPEEKEIKKSLDDCRQSSGALYAEVADISAQTGSPDDPVKIYSSGSNEKGLLSHAIYINLQSPNEIRHAKLSVYAKGIS